LHFSPIIIAIDGPAGSGKTSTARAVAQRLGFVYLDTGAMYRAATLAALDAGVALSEAGLGEALDRSPIEVAFVGDRLVVRLGGRDVTDRLRSVEVGRHVSQVSALATVRRRLVEAQRRFAWAQLEAGRGVVVDGRDIGTIVFPEAALKFYMSASPRVRAERRHRELLDLGDSRTVEQILEEIEARDAIDSTRAVDPLRRASDAVAIDTSGLTLDEQVSLVVNKLKERRISGDV
jgi:cytidylate kinase